MQYTSSLPFRGDPVKAFGLAETALTALGFRLTERTAGSVELVGPGMNSTRESALVGASRIHLLSSPGKLAVEADLGGVARMVRFVRLFPVGLVLSLGVVFSVVFGMRFDPGVWLPTVAAVVGGYALFWSLLVGPWMARVIRARTDRALDSLLANMVSVGESL